MRICLVIRSNVVRMCVCSDKLQFQYVKEVSHFKIALSIYVYLHLTTLVRVSLPEGKVGVAEVIELTDIRVKGDNDVSTKCDYINNCLGEKRRKGHKGGDEVKCERLTTGMCGISPTSGRRSCFGTVYQPPIIEYWSCHSNERGPRHPMLLY